MEEIAKLLREGKTPREIIKMGYPESTVYTVKKRLEKGRKREELVQVAAQLIHKRKGTLEIILSDLLTQAITTNNQIVKIIKICEAAFLLDEEMRKTIFTKDELERLERIYVVALSLQNKHTFKEATSTMKEVSLMLPVKYDEVEKYLEFLKNDPHSTFYVSFHTGSIEHREEHLSKVREKYGRFAAYKDVFFLYIAALSYNALKMYFIRWALPHCLKALNKIADLIEPSTFTNILAFHGGVVGRGSMGKRK